MMKLSLMSSVVSGLNSKWQHPLADKLCALWGMDRAVYIRASANVIFRCNRGEKQYYLRFNKTDISKWQVEVDLLLWLHEQGYPANRPVSSLQGRYLEQCDGWLAVMFEALPGKQKETDELSSDEYRQWGRALGSLHRCTQAYPGKEKCAGWRSLLSDVSDVMFTPAMHKELDELLAWTDTLPQDEDYGIIHYDFEQDNLFWDDTIYALDFEDCTRMWYVADIAFALRDLYMDKGDISERLAAFQAGYRQEFHLNEALFCHIPKFLRLHDFLMYIILHNALDLVADSSKPEWLTNLEAKLHWFLDTIEKREMYSHY